MGSSPWRLGLTGGIGSGKTTVSRFFSEYGAAVFDADFVARSVTGPGGAAISMIRQQLGDQAIAADGSMNRTAVRDIVFSDSAMRLRLEQIIHPLVWTESLQQEKSAACSGFPCILFDIPLLAESGVWRTRLDRILVVDCPERTQVERVVRRSGLSEEQVIRIVQSQAPRARRLSIADIVIRNDQISLANLAGQVRHIGAFFGL